MSSQARYTLYHPKWYRRRVSVWWWLQSWRYTKFVLRELTSVPVAFFALVILWQLYALGRGPQAMANFQAWLRTPFFLVVHALAFFAVLYHALTWFHLAPRALVVRVAGKRLPDSAIVALNYVAWLLASAVVAWVVLRG